MPIQKINITQFIEMQRSLPILDVRSPGEYFHAHIPGAFSLPLFTDEERKVVGTAYKQQSREVAIKIGLDYFGVKMRKMVEEVDAFMIECKKKNNQQPNSLKPALEDGGQILVHCWRGGMRSAGVAWLLDLYGYKVFSLIGGYKSYRNWVRDQFEKPYHLKLLGGYTGSGKTLILEELKGLQFPIINLEKIAHHKGSAFGELGESPQPTQEMFENILATELFAKSNNHAVEKFFKTPDDSIFVEDESQRIGSLEIPIPFWTTMRNSPIFFLEIPFEERLEFLTQEYGKYQKEKLVNAIIRIQKRLGGLETKNGINFLLENNHKECFRILLKYYDKWYEKGLYNRENLSSLLNKIPCATVDTKANTNILINEKTSEL
jgi:tRNA 2-selenouridine synthase